MDRIGPSVRCNLKDVGNVQVRLRSRRRSDIPCFVGQGDMQRVAIELRVDRDRADAELLGRTG